MITKQLLTVRVRERTNQQIASYCKFKSRNVKGFRAEEKYFWKIVLRTGPEIELSKDGKSLS